MGGALVSVIIPCYNAERFIEFTLVSILSQTYKNIEVICINDGSSDKTHLILDEYNLKFSKIKVINQKNQGVSVARNRGIEESKGQFIVFIDSDDIVPTNYIEVMMSLVEDEETVISTQISRFLKSDELDGIEKRCELRTVILDDKKKIVDYFYPFHNIDFFGSTVNKLYPRKVLVKNKTRFNPMLSVGEDLVFNLSVLRSIDSWIIIKNLSYFYRVSSSSLTFTFRKGYLEQRLIMIKALHEVYTDFELEKSPLAREYLKACYSELFNLNNELKIHTVSSKKSMYTLVIKKIFEEIYNNNIIVVNQLDKLLFNILKLPFFMLEPIVFCMHSFWKFKMRFLR